MAGQHALKELSAAITLAVSALLVTPLPALAHAELVRSTPAANSSVSRAPATITLTFDEAPEAKLSRVQAFDVQHQRVDDGPVAAFPNDPRSLVERLKPDLPRGVYTVAWQATSADDGHITGGSYAFGVGVVPSAASAQFGPSWESQVWPDGLIRWAGYLSVLGLLGLLVFRLAVVEPTGEADGRDLRGCMRQRCRAAGQWLAGGAVVAAAATIGSQAARSSGLSAAGLASTLPTSLGRLLVLRLAIALVILAIALAMRDQAERRHRSLGAAAAAMHPRLAARSSLGQELLIALTLGELIVFAMTSHALAVEDLPQLAVAIVWLHMSLAGVWVGGLIGLVLAVIPTRQGRRELGVAVCGASHLSLPMLKRFSGVALVAAAGLALTGLYQGWVHIGSLGNALSTDYGRAVLIKTAVFAAALSIAAAHRFAVIPGFGARRAWLPKTLPLEALLVVMILAVTGVVTSLPPANQGPAPRPSSSWPRSARLRQACPARAT